MNKKNSIQQELKEMPLLKDQLGQAEGYQVPDGYFKDLDKKILDQVNRETTPNNSTRTKSFSFSSVWGKAAAIVLLVSSCLIIWQKNVSPSIAATTELSTEEIHAYIADNLQEFDEDLLLDQVSSNQSISPILSEEEKDFFLEELMEDTSLDLEDIL